MRVLMLGWELPPHNSGGLGIACYEMCKALGSLGVDIEFILPYDSTQQVSFMNISSAQPNDVSEIIQVGSAYDSYKYIKNDGTIEWHDIYSQQAYYEKAVERLVSSLEFDVIHAHDWLTFRAAIRAKAVKNRPMILHVHSLEHDRAGGKYGNPLVHEIEYSALTMADKVIAVSNHTKKLIVQDYGIPPNKISVVHNSINSTDIYSNLTDDNSFAYLENMKNSGYKVVTNAGRLTIQKGLVNLLHSMKEVVQREPKTILLLVGSGDQYFELIELAASLGISKNVIFTGFLRGKQLRDAFIIADLFVMPSVSEPFGLTPLEAAGYKTPSLISKQSGVTEVFRNCLKVDYWDINKMANDILAVIKNDALRDELSQNAYSELMNLSWGPAAEQISGHYLEHTSGVQV